MFKFACAGPTAWMSSAKPTHNQSPTQDLHTTLEQIDQCDYLEVAMPKNQLAISALVGVKQQTKEKKNQFGPSYIPLDSIRTLLFVSKNKNNN